MLPKYCRIIVFISGHGYLTAYTAAQARLQAVNIRQRGFRPLFHFRAPLRRHCCGWARFYHDYAKRACEFGL